MKDVERAPPMKKSSSLLDMQEKGADTTLAFRDVRFEVGKKNARKEILHGVSGQVCSGEVLAILGPSGAGKTCLIDLLTLEAKGGEYTGDVRLNGNPLTPELFTKHCATVPQVDRLWAFLTVEETLMFTAELLLHCSAEEKAKKVNAIIQTVGLDESRHTKCGNQFLKGLSGGQRRRLSLAVALVGSPSVLFLDEPTSGLDAAAAASIMSFLKDLAQAANIAICCTIHQPSNAVFSGFDKIMLLSKGRVAYLGPASKTEAYFANIGYPVTSGDAIAEHMLNVVNAEFSDPKQVNEILDTYKPGAPGCEHTGPLEDVSNKGTTILSQTKTLVRRHGIITYRDPSMYLGRMVAFLLTCAFFSVVYIESRSRSQDQVFARMWLVLWFLGVPSSLGVVATYVYNEEFYAIKREVKNGLLSPYSYLLSNLVIQIPLMVVLALFALAVPAYGMVAWYGPHFVQVILMYALTLWSFEAAAQLFSVAFDNPLLGMLNYMNIWFGGFLFCGIMVREGDVIWPFRSMAYITFLKWSIKNIVYMDFIDAKWTGAVDDSNSATGYSCGASPLCFGRTGKEVLTKLHYTYDAIDAENKLVENAMILLAIGCAYKLMHVFIFVTKSKKAQTIGAPLSTSA